MVYSVVKDNVTTRQVAMQYGIKSIGAGWLAVRFMRQDSQHEDGSEILLHWLWKY